ncbi:MAG: ferrous iron transport protein A [Rhodothermales bacterium]
MTLNDLKPGACGRVCGCNGISERLCEIGILPGAMIEVVRVAPLGDPIALRVKDCQIAIRRSEATLIDIEAV